jgi:DNA-binding beta-propeller fold protein YncE
LIRAIKTYFKGAPFYNALVPNFIKLPTGLYLGEGIGVASNSKGHFFVFTRSGRTRLFEFDRTGEFVREVGDGLYAFEMAHGVRVDSQDNIWVVDEGSNMIVEFNPQGRVIMVLGRKPEAGGGRIPATPANGTPPPPAQPYILNRPTDLAWDPAGNIFVADGYGNSRIVKYDKNGVFVKAVGTKGKEPLQFDTPHTIAADAQGNIYVGDRGNRRIQVLDNDLNLKKIIDNVGAPWAICVTPARTSICTPPTPIPIPAIRDFSRCRAKSTRWSWMARSLASSERPARCWANSAPRTGSTAATKTSC